MIDTFDTNFGDGFEEFDPPRVTAALAAEARKEKHRRDREAAVAAIAAAAASAEDQQLAHEATRKRISDLVGEPNLREVLPPRIAGLLIDRAAAFPCNPVSMLGPLLVGAASIAGTRVRAQVKRGWQEPLVIWTLNIQEPSELKTPSTEVCTSPLYTMEGRARAAYADEKAEAEQRAEDGEKVQLPPPRRYVVDDATYERVAEICGEPRTVGLASMHDEVSSWFTHLDRKESTARSGWLKLWSGGPALLDRKVAKSSFATRTAVSVFGNTQPDKYLELVEKGAGNLVSSGDGLFSRFLPCRPRSVPWVYNDLEVTIGPEIQGLLEAADKFLASLVETAGESPTALLLTLSPEAIERGRDAWNQWAAAARDSNPGRAAFLGKLRGYSVRLAALIRLLALADAYVADSDASYRALNRIEGGPYRATVGGSDFEAALQLCSYYLSQFDILQGDTGGAEIPALVAKVLQKVVDKGAREVTPRLLVQWRIRGRGAMSTAEAQTILKSLVEQHRCGSIRQGLGGRITWLPPDDLFNTPAGNSPTAAATHTCGSMFNGSTTAPSVAQNAAAARDLPPTTTVQHDVHHRSTPVDGSTPPEEGMFNVERVVEHLLNGKNQSPEGISANVELLNIEPPVGVQRSGDQAAAEADQAPFHVGAHVECRRDAGDWKGGWTVTQLIATAAGWFVLVEHDTGDSRSVPASRLRPCPADQPGAT